MLPWCSPLLSYISFASSVGGAWYGAKHSPTGARLRRTPSTHHDLPSHPRSPGSTVVTCCSTPRRTFDAGCLTPSASRRTPGMGLLSYTMGRAFSTTVPVEPRLRLVDTPCLTAPSYLLLSLFRRFCLRAYLPGRGQTRPHHLLSHFGTDATCYLSHRCFSRASRYLLPDFTGW